MEYKSIQVRNTLKMERRKSRKLAAGYSFYIPQWLAKTET
jgi:hypothetical protein